MNSLESHYKKIEYIANLTATSEKYHIIHLRSIIIEILEKSINSQYRNNMLKNLPTLIITGNDPSQSNKQFLESRLIAASKKIHLMNATKLFKIIQINKEHGPKTALDYISPLIEVPLYSVSVKQHDLKIHVISLNNQESDQKYPQKL